MKETDFVIIGAGPAGISLAIYAKRAGLSFLLIDKGAPGGKLLEIADIHNYPGFEGGAGIELALKMAGNLNSLGIEATYDEIRNIQKEEEHFIVEGLNDSYKVKAVVLATGLTNIPSLPGEKEFLHKGVSYCATCDGPLYRQKDVCLIGKGERALEEALYLAPLVHTLHFYEEEMDDKNTLQKALLSFDNVVLHKGKVLEIRGKNHVESVLIEEDGMKKEIPVAAVFPLNGAKSATSFLASLPITLQNGFIPVDSSLMSNIPGLFAIGDVRVTPMRQVVTAVADGALVSSALRRYLKRGK